MRIPLINNNTVVNVVDLADDAEIITEAQLAQRIAAKQDVTKCWVPRHTVGPEGGEIGDTWDGQSYTKPLAPEPPPPTIDDYGRAIQAHIDATARAKAYDSAVSCASYVNSTNETWAAEAAAFVSWRDAVWAYALTELDKVQQGQRPQPTIDALVAELPAIQW